jgi:5'(3')-deoxyribonucleotidase
MGVILLDVDGVCADFTGMVRRLVKGMGGQMPWPVTQWDFIKALAREERKHVEDALEGAEGSWMDMEPIPGARGVVEAFRRAGHRVVFVTSPWASCREWAHVRTEWLHRFMGAKASDVIPARAKELVRGDVFIDDKPQNVAAWREAGLAHGYPGCLGGYLWDAPYNRTGAAAKSLPRITGGWTQENIQFVLDKAG